MTIKENVSFKADGHTNLNDRNYITLGLTYDEYLDLQSLIKEVVRSSTPGVVPGNRWVREFLMVERSARMAVNLLKRLNKIK